MVTVKEHGEIFAYYQSKSKVIDQTIVSSPASSQPHIFRQQTSKHGSRAKFWHNDIHRCSRIWYEMILSFKIDNIRQILWLVDNWQPMLLIITLSVFIGW